MFYISKTSRQVKLGTTSSNVSMSEEAFDCESLQRPKKNLQEPGRWNDCLH